MGERAASARPALPSGVSFMIMLDSNIVAVSLPSIARNLNATFADIEWVVSAYVLRGYAALLVAWLVHKLREEGVTPFLHVFTDNVSAIALCERLGFTTRKTLRLTVLSRAAGA